ncbi:MAG: histidine kinase N-terminal 7TM domain-containing protein [Actinomycetota bacterium]
MELQFSPYIIPMIMGIICILVFILYVYAYRPSFNYRILILLSSGAFIWLASNTLELASKSMGQKIFFNQVSSFGIAIVPIAFFIFTLQYTGRSAKINPGKILLLSIIPAAGVVLDFTNAYHNLIVTNYELIATTELLLLRKDYGLFFWIWVSYIYILMFVSYFYLIRLLATSIKFYKRQAVFLLMILTLPIAANIAYFLNIGPVNYMDFTPLSLTGSIIIMLLGITRLKLGEIVPITRNALIENMRDGILVTDKKYRILDINPLAKEIIGIDRKQDVVGLSLNKTDIWPLIGPKTEIEKVFVEENKRIKKFYELDTFNYKDHTGEKTASIIMLRDITERKKTENFLKERYEFSKLISNISANFAGTSFDINKEFDSALKKITIFTGVDRGYLFLLENKKIDKLWEYRKNNLPASPLLEEIKSPQNWWLIEFLSGFEEIDIKDMFELENLSETEERFRKEISKNTKSLLILPLYMGNKLLGCLGFETLRNTKDWNTEDKSLIRVAGNIFVNAIKSYRDQTRIQYLKFHDYQTGLYNRAYFEEELKRLDYKRYLPLSFFIIDINGLKLINDAFGFEYGNQVLKEVADLLRSVCRYGDILARWGGDEFAILFSSTSGTDALSIKQRIIREVEKTKDKKLQNSLALGIATKENPRQKIEDIIKEAEKRMDRQKLVQKKSISSSIISSLQRSLWEKSNETEEHAHRLEKLAVRLGRSIGLDSNQIDELVLLSSLHDIGKIAIPEDILEKNTKLSGKEWGKVKTHTQIGYRIAKSSKQLSHIANGILCHHEWWDGSGYPKGLKGTEIPITSRIISIIDAYDVMVNGRPYKKPVTKKEAMDELLRFSGIQFDPQLVKKFIEIIK